MDRKTVCNELKEKGLRVVSFDFTEEGYFLDLKATDKCEGMEVLDNLSINGFDVVRINIAGVHAKIKLVPNSDTEFNCFIKDFVDSYGLPEEIAMEELKRIVNKCRDGDNSAKVESFIRRRCTQ